jgi:hypothetical protein
MAARYLRRPDGKFAGSVAGATPPSTAPTAPTAGTAVTDRPVRPRFNGDTIAVAFAEAGVADPAGAASVLRTFLTDDGTFPIEAPSFEPPADPHVTNALLHGVPDLYLEHRAMLAEERLDGECVAAAFYMDHYHPGSGAVADRLLRDRAALDIDSPDFTPANGDTILSAQPHPFTRRLNLDTLDYDDAEPITMGEVRDLITREDRTLRTCRDLAVAAHLQGNASLKSGRWAMDHDNLTTDVLQQHLDEDTTYEALALIYSGGRSTNSGFDAVWEADTTAPKPPERVRYWLSARGLTGEWYAFGDWATA